MSRRKPVLPTPIEMDNASSRLRDSETTASEMPPDTRIANLVPLEVLSVGTFYRKYAPTVLRWATRIMPRYADDLAQETMIEAARDLGNRRVRGKYTAWLRSIFKNNYRDLLRRLGAARRGNEWRASSLDASDSRGEPLESRLVDTTSTPSLKASRRERLLRAITRLPPDQRDVTRLVFLEEIPPIQVAARLGTTDKQVQQLLLKAERNLKKRLQELCV